MWDTAPSGEDAAATGTGRWTPTAILPLGKNLEGGVALAGSCRQCQGFRNFRGLMVAIGWEGTLALSPALPSRRDTGGWVPLQRARPPAMLPGAAALPRGSGSRSSRRAVPWADTACPEPTEPAQPSRCPLCPAAPPGADATPRPDAPQLSKPCRATRAPRSEPSPAAEAPRRGMAGTERCLSLPVPGRWPIDGGGGSRLGTGTGSKCPCPC